MGIIVRLCDVIVVDDEAENSTVMPVHSFPVTEPIGAGTTFEWHGQRYVHYGDMQTGPNDYELLYMREQEVVQVDAEANH